MRSLLIASVFLQIVEGQDADCQDVMKPKGGPSTTSYDAATYTCPTEKPAVKTNADGDNDVATGGDETASSTACCFAAVTCDTTYAEFESGDDTKTDCPEFTVFKENRECYTVNTAATACGALAAPDDVTIDKAHCCPKKCKIGVVLKDVEPDSDVGQDIACTNEDASRVHPTAMCATSTCKSSDLNTCCQTKCTKGFQLSTGTSETKLKCEAGETISTTHYCSGPKCKTSDSETCCLSSCTSKKGWQESTGTSTDKTKCGKDLRVNPTGLCKATKCTSSGDQCCQQKCSKGFKMFGATTKEANSCGKDTTVHATGYCAKDTCTSTDEATCCQKKCAKGFKLHGATTNEPQTCAKGTKVSVDGKCEGSGCASKDSKTCCDMPCNDKTGGWKVKGGTGKEANECAKGKVVSSKANCAGTCSSTDSATCCLSANNSTATTDASGVGLTTAVGMMIILAVTS